MARKPDISWVVATPSNHAEHPQSFVCRRCGTVEKCELPIRVNDWCKAEKKFELAHDKCGGACRMTPAQIEKAKAHCDIFEREPAVNAAIILVSDLRQALAHIGNLEECLKKYWQSGEIKRARMGQ